MARKKTPKPSRAPKGKSGRRYAAQPEAMLGLDLPVPPRSALAPDMRKYFAVCDEKIGFLPNVLAAYSFDDAKLRAFIGDVQRPDARRVAASASSSAR